MARLEDDLKQSSNDGVLPASPATIAAANSKGNLHSPSFSEFEDGMLKAVRKLNRDEQLRKAVAARTS